MNHLGGVMQDVEKNTVRGTPKKKNKKKQSMLEKKLKGLQKKKQSEG